MEVDPFQYLLEPPPRWTHQEKNNAANSNIYQSESATHDNGRKKSDPGRLLEMWLAGQESALNAKCPILGGSNDEVKKPIKQIIKPKESIEEGDVSLEITEMQGSPDKTCDWKAAVSAPLESEALPAPADSASSSTGWKLHLFKAAVGIRKRREEYDTKRRRSLLALLNHALKPNCPNLPTQTIEERTRQEKKINAEDFAGLDLVGASTSHRLQLGCETVHVGSLHQRGRRASRMSHSHKRSSIVINPVTQSISHNYQGQRLEGLMHRFLLLQRKQLLASHQHLMPADLRVESLLGEGASGRVWRVVHRRTGKVFALKVIQKNSLSSNDSACARVYAERHLLIRSGLSRHLVKLHAAFQDENRLYLMQELLPGPSLFSLVQTRGPLPEEVARRYAAQLALAIHAVHKLGFIHRDIKPENAILDGNGDIKLIDMGLAAKPASNTNYSNVRNRDPTTTTPASKHGYTSASTPTPFNSSSSEERVGGKIEESNLMSKAVGGLQGRIAGKWKSRCPCARCTELVGASDQTRETSENQPEVREALLESFASWRLRDLSQGGANSCVGTLHYMAPEVVGELGCSSDGVGAPPETQEDSNGGKLALLCEVEQRKRRYAKKADWWSFGAVLFECLFGHPPFARFHLDSHGKHHLMETLHGQELHTNPPPPNCPSGETLSKKTSIQLASPESHLRAEYFEKSVEDLYLCDADASPSGGQMSCGISNPELLASMIRNWQKFLRVPPPPFIESESQCASVAAKMNSEGIRKPLEISKEAIDLLRNLLCEEGSRFGFNRIRRHPWFSSFTWDAESLPCKVTTKRKKSKAGNTKRQNHQLSLLAASKFPMMSAVSEESQCPQDKKKEAREWDPNSHGCDSKVSDTWKTDDKEQDTDMVACSREACVSFYGSQPCQRGGESIRSIQTPRQLGVQAATWSSSSSTPQCSTASTISGVVPTASDADSLEQTPEGLRLGRETTADGAQWDETGSAALCSWAAARPDIRHQNNKWLLDLRFLGFEFDRRRAQAKEAAKRLRCDCEKMASNDGPQ